MSHSTANNDAAWAHKPQAHTNKRMQKAAKSLSASEKQAAVKMEDEIFTLMTESGKACDPKVFESRIAAVRDNMDLDPVEEVRQLAEIERDRERIPQIQELTHRQDRYSP